MLVLIAFVLASVVGVLLQNYYQRRQSFTLLREYIEDYDANLGFDAEMKRYATTGWEMDNSAEEDSFKKFCDDEFLKRVVESNADWISELDIVDDRGIVAYTSNPAMAGRDLHSEDELSEFLCILDGEDYYAGKFYPNPFELNPSLETVYIAVSVKDYDGLVLFGFNEKNIHLQFLSFLWHKINTIHIGNTGYLIVCDMDKEMIGITDTAESDLLEEDVLYEGEVELPETENEIREEITEFYGEKCYVSAVKKPGYYLIAAYPVDDANSLREKYNFIFVVSSVIILFVLFVVLSILVNNHVVREIGSIHGSLKKITGGDLDEKAAVYGSLEFRDLSGGINDTVSNLKDRIQAAREQMAVEMENARRIQESAVPNVFPENDAFELYASMHTAEAVGGDFYDFFMRDEDTLVFVVADVSGKGMPAALYMMRAKTLIRTYAEQGLPVDEVAGNANVKLCEDASKDMFVTAWIGFLNIRTGELSYVHAGHTLPVLISDEVVFVKQKINTVLGGIRKAKYARQEIRLSPGDSIYLYTDGVNEAHNGANEMYGEEQLITRIREGFDRDSSCRAGCEMIYRSVMDFTGEAPQYDDITMMWIRYGNKGEGTQDGNVLSEA